MSAESQRAASDAKMITSLDHMKGNGASEAFQLFVADYRNSGFNADYLKDLTHDLVASKTLPDLKIYLGKEDSDVPHGAIEKRSPGQLTSTAKDPLRHVETTTTDVLAKDGNILDSVCNANGMIDKTQVDSLLKSMPPASANDSHQEKDIRNMLQGLEKNWGDLAQRFSHDGGKTLDLAEITKAGFDGKQTFDDRLKRDGNEIPAAGDVAGVYKFLKQNPYFLTDSNGVIDKQSVDEAFKVKGWAPEVQKVINSLHNSYNFIAGDDQKIHVKDLA